MIIEMTRNDVFGTQVIVDKIQRFAFITIVVIKMDIGQDHEDESSGSMSGKLKSSNGVLVLGKVAK